MLLLLTAIAVRAFGEVRIQLMPQHILYCTGVWILPKIRRLKVTSTGIAVRLRWFLHILLCACVEPLCACLSSWRSWWFRYVWWYLSALLASCVGLTDFRFDFWCYVSAVFQIAGDDHHVRAHAHGKEAWCHACSSSQMVSR